jgi:adenylate kinase
MEMLNLVLFGPPGAGKGTQAEFLIDTFNLIHLSTGDLLRSEIAAQTELGIEAKKFMDGGELVPDSVVIGMIKSKLESNKDAKGFIFDGFPRTVAQAEELDELLDTNGTPVSGMFCLEVEKAELVKRLLNRGLTSGRSDDADESVIENRINVYNDKTSPLINYYDGKQKFYPVIGMGTVEEIAGRLKSAVESI